MSSHWLSKPMFTLGWKCTPIALPSLKFQTLVDGSLILTLSYSLFLIFLESQTALLEILNFGWNAYPDADSFIALLNAYKVFTMQDN